MSKEDLEQDKINELIAKYKSLGYTNDDEIKKLCLITVNEIIFQWKYIDIYIADLGGQLNINLHFWQKIKQKILNKNEN